MLMFFSMGAYADVKILYGEKGEELKTGEATIKGDNGTIAVEQKASDDGSQTTVHLTFTPNEGFTISSDNIEVYAVISPDGTSTRAPEISGDPLKLNEEDSKDPEKCYSVKIDSRLGLWIKKAEFQPFGQKNRTAIPFEVTTTDDITNHTEKLYWIESAGATGFYAVPHSNNTNASTTNAPTLRALWYFTASGEDGYYYIINKETGTYLKKTGKAGDDNTIQVATYALADDDKFKFSFDTPEGVVQGYWVIYPKEAGTNGWLSKKSGNITYDKNWLKVSNWGGTPIGDLNSQWKIVARTDVQWPKSGLPFVVSTSGDKHYYRINHAQNTSYNVSYDGSNYATISNVLDNKTAWYFEEAATDPNTNIDNLKYYNIVNAETGKYLKFTATTINGNNQNSKYVLSDYDAGNEDRFQYVVVNSIGGNTGYSIMPKLAMSKYDVNSYANSLVPNKVENNAKLDLRSDRNNSNAHWKFVTTEYPMSCAITSITYSSSTGKITISSTPTDADIHYTNDGVTEPSSSEGTQYTAPFVVSSPVTIKAIATKAGYNDSEVVTVSFSQVATPTIQKSGSTAVSITCETAGATIYYTTDGSNPTISSTQYTGPLTENVSGVTIKAIAVKDGMINSAVGTGSVTLQCAKPFITRSGNNITIACNFPSSGVSIFYTKDSSEPSSSSTPYTSSFTAEIGDVIKAIAIASGYENSPIATKNIHDNLSPTDGKYLINSQEDFEIFVDMANEEDGAGYHYVLNANVEGSSEITQPFTGTFDGGLYTISDLSHPLFNIVNGGVVKNVILENVSIPSGSNVGAIAGEVIGTSSSIASIYNCGILSGSISGSDDVGGIVGQLGDPSDNARSYARVINCYSYANVTGGSNVGGIVGYNTYPSKASDIRTMVMNCMFYGDISAGNNISPIYGGENIENLKNTSDETHGLNTFNYYAYDKLKTGTINKYNCALAVEEKYLNRFEFYRLLLNSNKKLAAYYATGSADNAYQKMAKWVLETADRTIDNPKLYPVLKAQGKYPSIINYDAENAPNSSFAGRNKGGKLGKTLTVHLSGTGITTSSLTLQCTDKDFDRFNYNYDKVQLPYFNDVGKGNYENGMVVTGWKITSMSGGKAGTYNPADTFGGYNFADRNCTSKDLYDTSGRVFSQGAYFDVPYGVTDIYIEPYWGNAAFVADAKYDVVYDASYNRQDVAQLGDQVESNTKFNGKKVYTSIKDALATLSGTSVYDNAIVLVGNLHQNSIPSNGDKAFTIMSLDADHDNEPDYSMIYHHNGRLAISPIRFDFINIPGTAQAQKPNGTATVLNFTIFKAKGWFETTNTCLVYSNQLEYENQKDLTKADNSPLILLGGDFEQFVSTQSEQVDGKTIYIHVGSNVHIKSFGLGTHGDGSKSTPHIPVSVTGGEFEEFYLSGTYNQDAAIRKNDNAECYISGGYFKEAAGACQEQIDGDVHWQIYNADIDAFFGGGINAARPITGHVTTDIYNSHVTTFCGGPKFGDMQSGKKVTTNAEGCVFGKYFGGGYGGTSYSKKKYYDSQTTNWSSWAGKYTTDRGKYFDGKSTNAVSAQYGKKGVGVATDFDYEFFVWSTGGTGGRFYVKFASFSLATCNDVESNLKDCIVTNDFYGGGSYGEVKGKATSVLDGCTVQGNVFGGGYSATLPTIEVRNGGFTKVPNFNASSGMFEPGVISEETTECEWKNASKVGITLSDNASASHLTGDTPYYICTDVDLDNLGKVGETDLTVKGNTTVTGSVFGGGDESAISADTTTGATGNTKVTIEKNDNNDTPTITNVYGGGNTADVEGSTTVTMTGGMVSQDVFGGGKGKSTVVAGDVTVNIGSRSGEAPSFTYTGDGTVSRNVYGGSALGAVNASATKDGEGNVTAYTPTENKTTKVNIYGGTISGGVFGGGLGEKTESSDIAAKNFGHTTVTVENGTVNTAVYGGSNANGVLKGDATVTITGGTVGTSSDPISNAVFGGGFGQPTLVEGNVTVNIGTSSQSTDGATINGHVYGGGALGSVNASKPESTLLFDATKKTDVNLYAGTIKGDAYGGGLGNAETAAYVGGDVNVLLDGAKITGSIFGCNNLNGTPKGHVKVHVKRTIGSDKSSEEALAKKRDERTTYDVAAVYGGGNKADYVPTDATLDPNVEGNPAKIAAACAEVIIEGCEQTSIEYVYGGGNAAAVPATNVTILGSYIIDYVFGGGNGKGTGNPGANVGSYNNGATNYGSGKAVTQLVGGYIRYVYGGSNSKGNVRGGTSITMPESDDYITDYSCCEKRDIKQIYGAGNEAEQDGGVTLVLGCVDNMDYVYGGARNAHVKGGVDLVVTSGHFKGVYGGNDTSGSIQGPITLTIEETGCDPLIIDNLYLGGNLAAYSVYGYKKVGDNLVPRTSNSDGTAVNKPASPYSETQLYKDPILNVVSCTNIGNVFGGGYGSGATMYGSPTVNINMVPGKYAKRIDRDSTPGADNNENAIGAIGNVYGGGNAADVVGDTKINICTESNVTVRTSMGAEIPEADRTSSDVQPAYITGDVFGAGKGDADHVDYAKVTGNTTILMSGGVVKKSVYGGGELSQVGGNTNITVSDGTIGTPAADLPAGETAGAVYGNIYGGGKGNITNVAAGLIKGNTNVTISGGSIYHNIYGGGAYGSVGTYTYNADNSINEYSSGGITNITITGGTIGINGKENGMVFGSSRGDAGAPGSIHDMLAWVYDANVTVSNNIYPLNTSVAIKGSIYGSGENGHTLHDTHVIINNGIIGVNEGEDIVYKDNPDNPDEVTFSGKDYNYPNRGNVYGGGCGTDTYIDTNDGNKKKYNPLAGIVGHNATVEIRGGLVVHNVYGAGAMGSVTGNTKVSVLNNAAIGVNGSEGGNVYGAARGEIGLSGDYASVTNSEVEMKSGAVKNCIFGGGQAGIVKGAVNVSLTGGTVSRDVYGGGALAQTNTAYDSGSSLENTYKTTVTLAGTTIIGNLYGGGLGQKNGVNEATSDIAANVNGPVMVTVTGGKAANVFGCNNINGAPQNTVKVNIEGTANPTSSNPYPIGNVYGGGNQAAYTYTDTDLEVNISGGTMNNVFGGGLSADVAGGIAVKVNGGTVVNDVYGGGALANTNTANWNSAVGNQDLYIDLTSVLTPGTSSVYGLYEGNGHTLITNTEQKAESGKTYYEKRVLPGQWADDATNTTTVTLTGGVVGNAYGGGLGDDTTPVYVFGDVGVYVNRPSDMTESSLGVAFTHRTEDVTINGKSYPGVPITGNVFGCNNINGTPLGDVIVEVYSTRQINKNNQIVPGHGPNDTNGYDIQAVYGGGNQASYVPAADKNTKVTIWGCDESSISNVYGGGSSASVPATEVTIWGSYDIGYAFGGGNGSLPVKKGTSWQVNDGAGVDGLAKIACHGGKIGEIFGGSDAKGDCRRTSIIQQQEGNCPLHITKLFGAGKETNVDGDVNVVISACTGGNSEIEYVCGGSYKAHVAGNVHLTITSGYFKNVYGGNDQRGGIGGDIILDIEETDPCTKPIIIQNLVGGGNQADYPGESGPYTFDERNRKITVNVKSATRIDNIFGGCYKAVADADTEVNINMVRGKKSGQTGVPLPSYYGATGAVVPSNIEVTGSDGYVVVYGLVTKQNATNDKPASSVVGYYIFENDEYKPASGYAQSGTTYYEKSVIGNIAAAIGTIGNVYGGGNQGLVNGSSTVNIGTVPTVGIMKRNGNNELIDDNNNPIDVDHITNYYYTPQKVLGANILGDVFGGGYDADVTGNATVNYCTQDYTLVDYTGTTGFEGFSIGGSIYGGGNRADVLQNTNVKMSGGYVFNGIFGGGLEGSVGTYPDDKRDKAFADYGHTPNHAGCIGKPTECESGTGKCTVVVDGGQIGPVEVATEGMPNPHGWVWGGGCGLVEDPADNPDMHFAAYVNETDVTIGGTAFIMEGVIGGGEFGRVLGNTLVKIEGGQIGVGAGQTETVDGVLKPKRYTEEEFINPVTTEVTNNNALAACSHYVYGKEVGGKKEFKIYDPYADKYPTLYPGGSTDDASNGGTWIGIVCGGGSGYMPYEKSDGSGYDWCRSAGLVEGNSEVRITGGHILSNVYGANEYTDVLGNSKVTMSGGTIGVPRTLEQIAQNPLIGYLFGAGKGDARSHFDSYNNVKNTEVVVSGGIIYGSVLGGAEDGHVLGNTSVTISGGTIGTWGTTYYDGNVFGGGRGFSGENLIAGSVGGNASLNISGGTIKGSVYGGGRLASVGINSSTPTIDNSYGQLVDDETTGDNPKTYGHITMTISGGTIGTTTDAGHTHSGNVYGGSMGRIGKLDGTTTNDLWPKLAVAKTTSLSISGTANIMNNVYGGGEIGIVRNQATVNISGGTVNGSVFGGGYGSDDHSTKTTITPAGYSGMYYTFIPMLWAGCVSGNTDVTVSGGAVKKNVYGGGELASVGLIDFISDAAGNFTNMTEHESLTDGFGLSWPYEFHYHLADTNSPTLNGKATVSISGGRIGTGYDNGTGYVFGGSKGQVAFKKKVGNELVDITDINEQRYTEAFCANVRETEVNIDYGSTPDISAPQSIGNDVNCIMGAVYGGGEDGHVMENAAINFVNGLIGLSIYGGGKGEGTYTGTKYVYNESTWTLTENVPNIPSWTAGKVYGNTSITMSGGHVMGNVYGGGNLASVGKGNYAGGTDDYYPAGYGETLNSEKLWSTTATADNPDNAWHFLNSGKCTINITGGKVGTLNGLYGTVGGTSNATPTGMVFGGSRGRAAQDVGPLSPRYNYAPDFFLGYVNNTEVTIGTRNAETGPTIYSQVFGGGRDGHVRGSAKVEINAGTIGQTYAQSTVENDESMSDYQRYHRGNVYGSGSGLGTWDNGTHHGTSSGSVTRNTTVDIYGGTIYNNVYGGGAMATVGPPKINKPDFAPEDWSKCTVNIYGGTIGDPTVYDTYKYGGTIYGASRGDRGGDLADGESIEDYATVLWTEVNIKPHPTDRNKDVVIAGNVYGGARGGEVKKDTKVNLTGGVIKHNAYGGGRGMATIAANVGGNTTVELNNNNNGGDADGSKKGCVVERIFGCNDQNGTPNGDALVHVFATQNKNKDLISEKIAPPQYNSSKVNSETYAAYLKRLIDVAKPSGSVLTGINETVINDAVSVWDTYKARDDASLTDNEKKTITDEAQKVIAQLEGLHDYDVQAVYGGGDLALYDPTGTSAKTKVIIEGCSTTSIKQVYGGGNAAPVPETDVLVKSCLIIDELFGGGNGKDNYQNSDGKWYENPGANVGYRNYTEVAVDKVIEEIKYDGSTEALAYRAVEVATTPEDRLIYKYGKGIATTNVNGGHIHAVYGGSNMKGNISNGINLQLLQSGNCTLITDEAYASSKSATTDAESSFVLDCVKNGGTIYGGSYNADLYSDVNILIKNGHYDKIFGGNNQAGTINGSITITVAEAGCTPITIDELYGGGYLAPYSIYGYKTEKRNAKDADGNDLYDESHNLVQQRIPYMPGEDGALLTPYWNPRINIISATEIKKIFGGGYGAGATMVGSPLINVNMEKGMILKDKKTEYLDTYSSITTTEDGAGNIILPIGTIGDIYGGGNLADVIGDTNVEIGTGRWISSWDENGNAVWETTNISGEVYKYKLETAAVYYTQAECDEYNAGLTGALNSTDALTAEQAAAYNEAIKPETDKVEGNTLTASEANTYNATLIGARNTNDAKVPAKWGWYAANEIDKVEAPETTGRNAAKITGNVFGGGKGKTKESGPGAFQCASAMVGADGDGLIDANGGTSVTISNGSVDGSVYGGGEIGRVEKNTVVTIGIPGNTTNEITIAGNVFGAGKGVATHGYAALVRGNSTVTIQGRAKVGGSVYGGGEIASVGRYNIDANGLPQSLANEKSGNCTVIIRDDAEIGPDNMTMTKAGGPDNAGHVFGAGKGATPYVDKDGNSWSEPWRVKPDNSKDTYSEVNETQYLKFIETLGLATQTNVTISGNAFVKGDVFGGAEQGFVQHDTHVTIEGNCQIGNGYVQMADDGTYLAADKQYSLNRRYTDEEWATGHLIKEDESNYSSSLPECASWPYLSPYASHDIYADTDSYDSKGGAVSATSGHTFYGNVFGGGSGYFPYKPGKWHWKAGNVGGNTLVEINGGHILTNVYGGNEMTNVDGKSTITMTGGTIGVPRTLGQIMKHPVTCYLFGGGGGDPRVLFNKQTNVQDVEMNITGGWVYGSVFGGGEDGHVMRNVDITIGGTAKIGTWGTSYVDGNVFGGGRGFSGDAYTAGNVAGSVTMNINGGEILGSVYGGGRLGSVGYGLYDATTDGQPTPGYGEIRDDHKFDNGSDDGGFFTKGRGHVNITISGGTIGNPNEFIIPNATNIDAAGITETDISKWKAENEEGSEWTKWKKYHNVPNTEYDPSNGRVTHTKGGNVYAGGMGRREQLDGVNEITVVDWRKLGNVKSTKLTISGANTWVMGNVYGGGEVGAVLGYHNQLDDSGNPIMDADDKYMVTGTEVVIKDGATIGTEVTESAPVKTTVAEAGVVKYTYGSVCGGGMGTMKHYQSTTEHAGEVKDSTKVTINDAATLVRASVFGGGEIAEVTGNTNVTINNGKIGRNEVRPANDANPGYVMFGSSTMGNVFGGGKGALGHTNAGQVKGNTSVTVENGYIYHNVYGGGALASVGTFGTSTGEQSYIPVGIPYGWTEGTGTARVTINGGTIGINGRDNGMVNGSSRGDIEKPNGNPAVDRYDQLAWVNDAIVTIGEATGESTGPHIMGSVYGGGENGHNAGNATVTVNRGTIGVVDINDPWYTFIPAGKTEADDDYASYAAIDKKALITRGNVYGAGCGTDTYTGDDGKEYHNPKSGMVAGNTFVNIAGGHIGHSVYGGGSMGPVGTIISEVKHDSEENGFVLSWPYEFVFKEGTGKATVNITGGHIGTRDLDGGDVFGSTRGEAGDRYASAHYAYVGETEVNIDYKEPAEESDISDVKTDFTIPCVTGSVHGSGEDGYVYGDARVTLNKGLIVHSIYGAGKGKGTYKVTLNQIGGEAGDTYESDIYSLIAGKVMGNTYVTMNDGIVGRNVYGGGNMASVGKGNYAGGTDDYYPAGYGEMLTGKLWDGNSNDSKAFLGSGKTTVNVIGGQVGIVTTVTKNNLPYGNVFGGSAGEAAPNVPESLRPREKYCPAFFSGYVNETDVTIGGYRCKTAYDTYQVGDCITAVAYDALDSGSQGKWEQIGPTIVASVYGGGQDGHVRRDTKVTVNSGVIGLAYDATNQGALETADLDNDQWLHRGNIYGGGSGISQYTSSLKYVDGFSEDDKVPETGYSTSAGSVTRFTEVNVLGGTIHRNVYGGGSMGSVGAPRIGQGYDPYKRNDNDSDTKGKQSQCTVTIGGAGSVIIGTPTEYKQHYGGEVYGACRGTSTLDESQYATSVWTQVLIKDGAHIQGNVYGGGDAGIVKRDTDVQIGEPVTTP